MHFFITFLAFNHMSLFWFTYITLILIFILIYKKNQIIHLYLFYNFKIIILLVCLYNILNYLYSSKLSIIYEPMHSLFFSMENPVFYIKYSINFYFFFYQSHIYHKNSHFLVFFISHNNFDVMIFCIYCNTLLDHFLQKKCENICYNLSQ